MSGRKISWSTFFEGNEDRAHWVNFRLKDCQGIFIDADSRPLRCLNFYSDCFLPYCEPVTHMNRCVSAGTNSHDLFSKRKIVASALVWYIILNIVYYSFDNFHVWNLTHLTSDALKIETLLSLLCIKIKMHQMLSIGWTLSFHNL